MKRLAPLFLVVCFVFTRCGAPTAVEQTFALGEPFWLAQGKQAVSSDGSTIVRFAAVVGDSRCPPEAVCIWAGEVTVDIAVRVAAGDEVITRLHQRSDPIPTPVPSTGRVVELLGVEGGAGAGSDLTKGYRAQLRVRLIP